MSKDVFDELRRWMETMREVGGVSEDDDVRASNLHGVDKSRLCEYLETVFKITTEILEDDFVVGCNAVQRDLIESQRSVIDLQKELLTVKNEQIADIKTAVKGTVSESVESSIKLYSAALNVTDGGVQMSQADLKSMVKGAIVESSEDEDRACNVMVWGLEEENGEKLEKRVGNVFEKLGEKPRLTCVRVGRKVEGRPTRPVRVKLNNATAVKQILSKSRNLKTIDQFKTVFVSPDRSIEEREKHRLVVTELKRRVAADPDSRHYIRGGAVCSEKRE